MTSLYDSDRMAAAYTYDRPLVHERILRSARLIRQADRALDVGCGAGLSTAALMRLARQVIGLEPVSAMLVHRQAVAPHARFVVGQAERLPFAARSFDLVAAAGSLNYIDLPSALAEISRVLSRTERSCCTTFPRPALSERRRPGELVRLFRAAVPAPAWLAVS